MSFCDPEMRTPWCQDEGCEKCGEHRPKKDEKDLLLKKRLERIRVVKERFEKAKAELYELLNI